jgi:hypothetical protein
MFDTLTRQKGACMEFLLMMAAHAAGRVIAKIIFGDDSDA